MVMPSNGAGEADHRPAAVGADDHAGELGLDVRGALRQRPQ